MAGVDLDGWLGAPKKKSRAGDTLPSAAGIKVTKEQIDDLLDDSVRAGAKLAAGVGSAAEQLEQIANSGLTFEALVLLTQASCPPYSNRHCPTAEHVRAVLLGLFKIREHLR